MPLAWSITVASAATDPRDVISRCPTLFPYLSPLERRKKGPNDANRYSFRALLTYRLPLISYTRNIANRNTASEHTFASHEIAFAYGADCPVPRVKNLARPWWLVASFVPPLIALIPTEAKWVVEKHVIIGQDGYEEKESWPRETNEPRTSGKMVPLNSNGAASSSSRLARSTGPIISQKFVANHGIHRFISNVLPVER